MQDDREEFEQDQVHRDREDGAEEFGMLAALHERSRRFSEAMDRLDAEVAEHEGEIEPYLVRHPEMLEDLHGVVRAPITPGEAASLSGSGARFGDRLRKHFTHVKLGCPDIYEDLADAIDRDRDELRGWVGDEVVKRVEEVEEERRAVILAELKGTVRRQIEGAVERLSTHHLSREETGDMPLDCLNAEDFLAELDRIFGERPEGPPQSKVATGSRWFEIPGREGAKGLRVAVQLDGQTFLWPLDPEVHSGFALSGEAARDLEIILRAFLPGDVALEALPPEHEAAHDRRERESARNEDSRGRVEGVDR